MTVFELIERLKELDQEAMVVVRGYEGGVNEVTYVDESELALDVNTAWYYGKHELISHGYKDMGEYKKINSVHIGGHGN
jgi:hypothetical protein